MGCKHGKQLEGNSGVVLVNHARRAVSVYLHVRILEESVGGGRRYCPQTQARRNAGDLLSIGHPRQMSESAVDLPSPTNFLQTQLSES